MPNPIGGGGGGLVPPDPGQTCAGARSQIASLTLTVANLTSLLARTQDPVQRADIQAGINTAQEEISVLRAQLPFLCAPPPPPPPPPPPVPVLVVLDSDSNARVSFAETPDPTDGYFTISQFMLTLEASGLSNPGPTLALTRAHRQTDPGGSAAPSGVISNAFFTWQSSTAPAGKNVVDLSQFQVVFLFGAARLSNPPDPGVSHLAWDGGDGEAQVWAFVQYMNSGRGLFATGDHEDLGASMCAAIPRVRSMRRWLWLPGAAPNPGNPEIAFPGYDDNYQNKVALTHPFNRTPYDQLGMVCAPPALGPLRHDTLQPLPSTVNAGQETVFDPAFGTTVTGIPFDRQSDDIPQPITVVTPHPIFDLGGVQLAHFPDHMHEGVTIDLSDTASPDPLTTTYTHQGVTVSEYPSTAGVPQPVPQVLVRETVLGGHLTPTTEYPTHVGDLSATEPGLDANNPEPFGGVSVYDGTPVGVGRIVTDATFHHFFDINIKGDPSAIVRGTADSARLGFTNSVYLTQFMQYWVNLVTWLANPGTATPMLMAAVDHARRSSAIRMSAGPGMAAHGAALHDLGAMAIQAVSRHLPAALLRDAIHHAMPTTAGQGVAYWLTSTRTGQPDVADAIDRVLLHGFMGGAVLHSLGLQAEQSLAANAQAVAEDVVSAGLRGAAKALAVSKHSDIAADLIAVLAGLVPAVPSAP